MEQNRSDKSVESVEPAASKELVEVANIIVRLGGMMAKLSDEEKASARRMLDAVLEKN